MHESRLHAQTPQWNGAQLVSSILRSGLYNSVPSIDVVQQKIAEGMNDLTAERVGHHEYAAVEHRSCWGGRDRLDLGLLEQVGHGPQPRDMLPGYCRRHLDRPDAAIPGQVNPASSRVTIQAAPVAF